MGQYDARMIYSMDQHDARAVYRILILLIFIAFLQPGCDSGHHGGGAPNATPACPGSGTAMTTPIGTPAAKPGEPAPRISVLTPEGVMLEYPVWLDQYPDLKDELLTELRETAPNADPRIAVGVRGVPAGSTVIVLDPGAYYAPYSPSLLASGEWRTPSTIYLAWRPESNGPVVPALAHELRHLLTQDPLAGH